MKIDELIEHLQIIRNRHPLREIDVEVYDEGGVKTSHFGIRTEYVLNPSPGKIRTFLGPQDEPTTDSGNCQ